MISNYENLIKVYNREESIVFYKTKEDYGGLSNMAAGYGIEIGNCRFKTSEALYQACRYPHLIEIQKEIMEQNSPMTAKMKSKKHTRNTRKDWEQVRVPIMRWCIRMKLINNWAKFGNLLRVTEEKDIVEESRKDDFWGAYVIDNNMLRGANILGRLLVETRKNFYRLDHTGIEFLVEPPPIDNFLIMGLKIDVIKHRVVKSEHIKAQKQLEL